MVVGSFRAHARHRRQRYQSQGSVLVETAVIFPLVLLIIAGIIDLGYVFQQSTVIYQASRAGARTAGSMTAKLSPTATAAWCGATAAELVGSGGCATVLGGNFPNDAIPLRSGMYMACHYLREAGFEPTDWRVEFKGPVTRIEDPGLNQVQMRWLEVKVQRAHTAQKCLFCLQDQFESLILDETSFFPVQCES